MASSGVHVHASLYTQLPTQMGTGISACTYTKHTIIHLHTYIQSKKAFTEYLDSKHVMFCYTFQEG